jgi:hypothetical protein
VLTAITLEDIPVNSTGQLCIQGVVVNPIWNFTTVGAQLWVLESGELIDIDPHLTDPILYPVEKVAIARVISPTSIYFTQGLGAKGDSGDSPLSTTSVFGIVKLSTPAVDIENPIVVGDNDPRLIVGALDGLSDVVVPTPTIGDILEFNGTNWVNVSMLAIANGGTGAITAAAAINNLLPTQTGNANKTLATNGFGVFWKTELTTLPYDLAFYIATTPYDINTIVAGFLSTRVVTITSTSIHLAVCSTPPVLAATVFEAKVQGVTFATITFDVGSTSGVISFTAGSTVNIAAGYTLTLSTTGVVDSNIAGIGITFIGVSPIS